MIKRLGYIFIVFGMLFSCSNPDKVFEKRFSYRGEYTGMRKIELYSDGEYIKTEINDEGSFFDEGIWEGIPTDGNSFSLIVSERNGIKMKGEMKDIEVYEVQEGKAGLDYKYIK
jgi:hypothetical protein